MAAVQATVRTFDPRTRSGTLFLDDGTPVGFGREALDAGPLRTLRPGQRVTISMLGDVVVTITHPGFSPPGGDEGE
ncbi:hypothetical protein GCM10010106_47900 [Thermopolyspora flexuosa]|jgi:2-phospho-L-lactate guanylyltransferase|nr:hypothetical protein GCM10010106_47900 [Thermopolyspora flexuosa]